jgi:hypothetical protein
MMVGADFGTARTPLLRPLPKERRQMKKLNLSLDALVVETFTAGVDPVRRGTVKANEMSMSYDCQTQCHGCTNQPSDWTCKDTCAGETCVETCAQHATSPCVNTCHYDQCGHGGTAYGGSPCPYPFG